MDERRMVLSRRRQMPKSPKRPEVHRCHSSSFLLRATYFVGVARNSVITLGRCYDSVGSASEFWGCQCLAGPENQKK